MTECEWPWGEFPQGLSDWQVCQREHADLERRVRELEQAIVYAHRWLERAGPPRNPKLQVLYAAQLECVESAIEKISAKTLKELTRNQQRGTEA